MSDYDVVVIGSGAGGLTSAVALANAGQRVLVLEQHYIAGGWCQSFVLDKYRYSPGVHYIGELGEGQMMRRMYEGLGLSQDIEFCRLNPDGFDHYIVAGERLDVPEGKANYSERLKARFPRDAKGIDDFFRLVGNICSEMATVSQYSSGLKALQLPFRTPNIVFHGMRNLDNVLRRHIDDPLCRAILTAPAGDYGLGPKDAPLVLHAGVMGHYFDGGYYPRGGAHRIPRAYIKQLKRKGGEIRLSTPVTRILVENGRAAGVELGGGERISAKTVISNADPYMTYNKLLGLEHTSRRLRRKLRRTEYSIGSLSLFLATDLDLGSMGYDSGNYWFYETTDIDAMYPGVWPEPDGRFEGCFVTVTTLKDPSKRKDGHHTLEVFAFVPYEPFKRWENQPCGERDPAYEALKSRLADKLLDTANKVIPGLKDNLVFMDVGTPLSNGYYCASHLGNVYGNAKTRRQLGPGSFPIGTELDGLYMVGQNTLSHGVLGASMSGMVASAKILRCRFTELFSEQGPPITIYPSEQPELWLDSLRKRRNRPARQAAQQAAAA